jgi:hypothetical protein
MGWRFHHTEEEDRGGLLEALVPGEADRAQELYLHEEEDDQTGDEFLSSDELDDHLANLRKLKKSKGAR